MRPDLFKIILFVICLSACCRLAKAQQLQYSRQNVFLQSPNDVQVVANVSGMHHLLAFSSNENISLFVFNNQLQLEKKLITPIKLPEDALVKTIQVRGYYYIYILTGRDKRHILWKVDPAGIAEDFTAALELLLQNHMAYIESEFQLVTENKTLQLTYHTYIPNLEKNVFTVVSLDSLLHPENTTKVMYDLKEDGEKVLQETFIDNKQVMVLKSTGYGTGLQLMKIDIATGRAVSREFFSSGYHFMQSAFAYDPNDSSTVVSALLLQPNNTYNQKHYVFAARLDTQLVEHLPFKLHKSQYRRNTGTNFIFINRLLGWRSFSAIRPQVQSVMNENGVILYDFIVAGQEETKGVRFSMLNKNLDIAADTLIRNNRNAYTLKPSPYACIEVKDKNYLVLRQQFFNKRNGLFIAKQAGNARLEYRYLPVQDRYKYLVGRAAIIPQRALIIPYLEKQGAGLLRISFEQN